MYGILRYCIKCCFFILFDVLESELFIIEYIDFIVSLTLFVVLCTRRWVGVVLSWWMELKYLLMVRKIVGIVEVLIKFICGGFMLNNEWCT